MNTCEADAAVELSNAFDVIDIIFRLVIFLILTHSRIQNHSSSSIDTVQN